MGEGTFEELIGEGRYEGPGIASGVVCTSKFLPHGDIATSQPGKEDLKWFRQNICKPGDQGIILKGPKGPTSQACVFKLLKEPSMWPVSG